MVRTGLLLLLLLKSCVSETTDQQSSGIVVGNPVVSLSEVAGQHAASEAETEPSRWTIIKNAVSSMRDKVSSLLTWLLGSEEYTTYDKSDANDVLLSGLAAERHSSSFKSPQATAVAASGWNNNASWTERVSQAAQSGRQFFSATNLLTLGYETGNS